MKDSWVSRDYRTGDEHQILGLYERVNQRQMALAHWAWKFTKNPYGKPLIKLMFDDDKLIGHYAVIPMNVQIGTATVDAALSVNTMTHPDYQGQGIFTYLAEETYKECQQQGLKFVYGFPNENSYYGFTRKLGWKDLGRMIALEKRLGTKKLGQIHNRKCIHPIGRFDGRVNVLWHKVKNSCGVIVPRTERFLTWRFTEHPMVKYPEFVFQGGSDEILGYMVLKTYADNGEIKGHIVDMLCLNDKGLIRDLIRYAEHYFANSGIANLSCWAAEQSLYGEVLAEEGFKRQEFGVYFGVRTFDKRDKALQNVEQRDSWHLAMADLDVF